MLTSKFNKIGDTSFRVADQLQGYLLLLEWWHLNFENRNVKESELEEKFVKWAKKENIYGYKVKNKFGRIKFVLNTISKKTNIITKNKNKTYTLNKEYDSKNPSLDFFVKIQKYYKTKNIKPFGEMCKFLYKNRHNENINTNNVIFAFFVIDSKESFEELYNMGHLGIQNKILNVLFNDNFSDINKLNSDQLYKRLSYRKPNKERKQLTLELFDLKLKNKTLKKEKK